MLLIHAKSIVSHSFPAFFVRKRRALATWSRSAATLHSWSKGARPELAPGQVWCPKIGKQIPQMIGKQMETRKYMENYTKPQFNIQDWKSKDRFLGYVQTNRFNSSRIRNLTPSVINIATEYTMCTFVGLIMHTCHMLIFPVPSLITKGESNHGNLTKKNGDVSWTIGFCQHTCGLYQQNEANINIE